MKILLTGAAGFIGSHVARALLERGDTVIGMDDFNDHYDPNQKWANTVAIREHENFELIAANILDIQAALFEHHKFDAVVHLAAMAGVRKSIRQPALYLETNVTGSQRLMDLSRTFEVQNFVFASTSSVYGHTRQIPFTEDDPCCQPLHPYAASKRAVEQIGYAYHQCYGMNLTVLRLFTAYGPSGRPDMLPTLLAESITSGRAVPLYARDFQRDWTYIDEIASGIVTAVDRPLGFEIINLGRGRPESLIEFIRQMERVAGQRANVELTRPPSTEMAITFADNRKAARLLGFTPKVSIEAGIEEFWKWFCSHRKFTAIAHQAKTVCSKSA